MPKEFKACEKDILQGVISWLPSMFDKNFT